MDSADESSYALINCEDFARAVQKLLVKITDAVYENADTAIAGTLERLLYVTNNACAHARECSSLRTPVSFYVRSVMRESSYIQI